MSDHNASASGAGVLPIDCMKRICLFAGLEPVTGALEWNT